MPTDTALVLDVGQCRPDHLMIRRTLTDHFEVRVEAVPNVPRALEAMRRNTYALILVNRLIDEDRSEGLALIRRARQTECCPATPIMLISDYEEAQRAALEVGAVRGFGKSQVNSPATVKLLARYLRPK